MRSKGSAVSMPWIEDVNGVLQAWYSGNEAGNAIADILFGTVNPSGRLPLTFPVQLEDIPAYPNLYSEGGKIHYREDLFVGYKHYQGKKIKPLFNFGYLSCLKPHPANPDGLCSRFGLSYTTFSYGKVSIAPDHSNDDSFSLKISLPITNTGAVTGSETVQLYIEFPNINVTIPLLQLKGFVKTGDLAPGSSKTVSLVLDKYAVSFWDSTRSVWSARAGKYRILLGSHCEKIEVDATFELAKSFYWSGL